MVVSYRMQILRTNGVGMHLEPWALTLQLEDNPCTPISADEPISLLKTVWAWASFLQGEWNLAWKKYRSSLPTSVDMAHSSSCRKRKYLV
jgi:hypothetical protein